jgi:type I restriction enzyme M protein
MLTTTKDFVLGSETKQGVNPDAQVHLFGQEVNPETFAICKSDLFMKEPDGYDADRIVYGSTLEKDGHPGRHFDYQIANPPYGKDWKRDKDAVEAEAQRGDAGRFPAGTPRISDGQLLFLARGQAVARAEVRRMESAVAMARAANLIPRPARG